MPVTRRQMVFFVLGGFFLTNAILGELTGGKLFTLSGLDLGLLSLPRVNLSIGVIPWPVVFITTDLVNEYYGQRGVRKLTLLAVGMISYAFVILYLAMLVPAMNGSPVSGEAFAAVFGQSMWIIVGSLTAFLVSQLIDVVLFTRAKEWTGHRMLWLRATGSTVISQMFDTFLVGYIAFVLPGELTRLGILQAQPGRSYMMFPEFLRLAAGNYTYKIGIAILITPIIYIIHKIIDRFLERDAEPGLN